MLKPISARSSSVTVASSRLAYMTIVLITHPSIDNIQRSHDDVARPRDRTGEEVAMLPIEYTCDRLTMAGPCFASRSKEKRIDPQLGNFAQSPEAHDTPPHRTFFQAPNATALCLFWSPCRTLPRALHPHTYDATCHATWCKPFVLTCVAGTVSTSNYIP